MVEDHYKGRQISTHGSYNIRLDSARNNSLITHSPGWQRGFVTRKCREYFFFFIIIFSVVLFSVFVFGIGVILNTHAAMLSIYIDVYDFLFMHMTNPQFCMSQIAKIDYFIINEEFHRN